MLFSGRASYFYVLGLSGLSFQDSCMPCLSIAKNGLDCISMEGVARLYRS